MVINHPKTPGASNGYFWRPLEPTKISNPGNPGVPLWLCMSWDNLRCKIHGRTLWHLPCSYSIDEYIYIYIIIHVQNISRFMGYIYTYVCVRARVYIYSIYIYIYICRSSLKDVIESKIVYCVCTGPDPTMRHIAFFIRAGQGTIASVLEGP